MWMFILPMICLFVAALLWYPADEADCMQYGHLPNTTADRCIRCRKELRPVNREQ